MPKLILLTLCLSSFLWDTSQVQDGKLFPSKPEIHQYTPPSLENGMLKLKEFPNTVFNYKKLINGGHSSRIITLPQDGMKCLIPGEYGFIPNFYEKGQQLTNVIPIPNAIPNEKQWRQLLFKDSIKDFDGQILRKKDNVK